MYFEQAQRRASADLSRHQRFKGHLVSVAPGQTDTKVKTEDPFKLSGIFQIFLQSIIKEHSKSLSSGQIVQVGYVISFFFLPREIDK